MLALGEPAHQPQLLVMKGKVKIVDRRRLPARDTVDRWPVTQHGFENLAVELFVETAQ
jgi:hypothetical protein